MKIKFLCLCLCIGSYAGMNAQVQSFSDIDSLDISRPSITVLQPEPLKQLLLFKSDQEDGSRERGAETLTPEGTVGNKSAGYRVQVFSDNNQRTAKNEARSKEKMIKEAFPEFGTYIVYNSPFWRLKVGDFKTQHEADAAADAIKLSFPSFSREVRVVRDRINTHR